MSEWKAFLKEGGQYLKAAQGKEGKPSRLQNDVRYNLLALSFEKSVMSIVMFNNDLADNHTFTDLLHAVGKYVKIEPPLHDEVIALEEVQSICNLYEYHRELPSDSVVSRMQTVAKRLYEMAGEACGVDELPVVA